MSDGGSIGGTEEVGDGKELPRSIGHAIIIENVVVQDSSGMAKVGQDEESSWTTREMLLERGHRLAKRRHDNLFKECLGTAKVFCCDTVERHLLVDDIGIVDPSADASRNTSIWR